MDRNSKEYQDKLTELKMASELLRSFVGMAEFAIEELEHDEILTSKLSKLSKDIDNEIIKIQKIKNEIF